MKKAHIKAFFICIFYCFTFVTAQAQHLEKGASFIHYKCTPFYNLKKLGNTEIFRGNHKKNKYFEGWYFKMVSANELHIMSVIPGISISKSGEEQHAFIQLIDGTTAQTQYFTYPISDFSFSRKEFAVKIADNYFSKEKIVLNLSDSISNVSGKVEMFNRVDLKSNTFMNPGIMGWYRFVPFMQCYHGVVSLTHRLKGHLTINNKQLNFNKGKGYIEKDWGKSMPSSWVWMQSNHFTDSTSSFMLSIADVPWLGMSFNGFLGFLYHDDELYRFATYRNSKLKLDVINDNQLKIQIDNRKNSFIIEARSNNTGMLIAPDEGSMERRIPESIDASLKITMKDKNGQVVFIDSTNIAGLEMVGDYKMFEEEIR